MEWNGMEWCCEEIGMGRESEVMVEWSDNVVDGTVVGLLVNSWPYGSF